MENKHFSTTILVDQAPAQVFEAINRPADWWPGTITGSSGKPGDEFAYRYEDVHLSTQKVAEMVPYERVVWLVTESQIRYVRDIDEWTGTRIIFELSEQDGKTLLRFTHEGLTPRIECFDSCSTTWDKILRQGLHTLLATGVRPELTLG